MPEIGVNYLIETAEVVINMVAFLAGLAALMGGNFVFTGLLTIAQAICMFFGFQF